MTPRVSIVMANYDGARFLAGAIASIQAQTLADWELIVVDDASRDASAEWAEAIARGDPRVRVLRQEANGGPAAARNRALRCARGDWLAVIDNDDLIAPDRLERMVRRAETDNADVVVDNLLVFSGDLGAGKPFLTGPLAETPAWIDLATYIDSNRLYSRLPDLGYLKPLFRAALIRRLGLRYDERLRIGEDYQFMIEMLAAGARLRTEPAALYRYRKHANSISHRIGAAELRALLDADSEFSLRHGPALSSGERQAISRRRRSLESQLIYDEAIHALKARALKPAAALVLGQPRIWPLLTRPVKARIERLLSGAARDTAHA